MNKESKEINFGLSPIPKLLKSPRSNAISEDEFHHTISSYFYSFRDIHHQYTYPRPYSCYSVIFPLSFDIAENRIVIVTDFSPGYPIAREFNPGLKSIVKKGDVLVSINGKSIDDLYQEHQLKTGGANYYGGITSLLNYFTLRHGSFYQLPEETDITYGLVRGSKSFEITLNIVGARDNYCIKKHLNIDSMVPELINSFKSKDENQDQEIKSSISRKRKSKSDEEEIQDQENNSPKKQKSKSDQIKSRKRKRLEFKHAAAQPSKNARGSTSFWKKTKDPFLSYREYKYKNSKMLIIKLLDFSPLKDNVQNALEKIYNLIIKYAFVDSILFDLRDNPGGQISLAEGIFQFFKLDAKLSLARALVTPLNKLLMASDHGDERWFEAISNSRGKYTNQIPYFNDRFVNHYGMIFLKPVGVLVNSACYSSCDMFTAGFQDNEIGVVYGTEPQTGG